MSRSTSFVRLFVGFILTATGVRASCPIELNPPSVVVKYGDPVSVNCSSSEIELEGMGWEAIVGGRSLQMANHLTWAVDSLEIWNIAPFCFINPSSNATFEQCSKTANVVLYTFPEEISINSSDRRGGVMKEGEGYDLNCHIGRVAPVKSVTVRWFKGHTLIHQLVSSDSNKKPVELSPVYRFTPSRQDDGVTLRCEAHMDLGPEGPQLSVSSQEYNITVHFGPDVQCYFNDTLEGDTLESHCRVEGNPTPSVRWTKDGRPTDPGVPLRRQDAGQYIIKANGSTFVQKQLQVLVQYGPELRCLSSYTALEHAPYNHTCIVDGYPQPEVTWYKDGEEVELPENLTRRDAGQYSITASNSVSSISVTVEINILYPPSLIVELEDSEVKVGSNVWLKCSSTGNPRPKYSWIYYRTDNVIEENEDGVSRLLIHNATAYNMGSYKCHASNEIGNVSETAKVTVKGAKPECPIEITPNGMVLQYQGATQNATCRVMPRAARNLKEISWQTNGSKTNKTVWHADTREDWDPRPVCIADFDGVGICGKPLNFILYKTPDSVSVRHVPNLTSVREGTELQLRCDVDKVAPAESLAVRWYHGNDTLKPLVKGSTQVTRCLPKNSSSCDTSRSPVHVSSTINVTLNRTHNGAEFRCAAQLSLGTEGPQSAPIMMSSPVSFTVSYEPTINTTKLPKAIPVFRGYPEELVCEADGHPPPHIRWLYSPDKVPHVSGGALTVSEAGLYNCTATNDLGTVFHVVEVVLKEDYLPLIAGFVAVTVVAISIIFLFIYSIYYKNTKMRRYSLKNPKLNTHNGNVAHNGWDLQFPMTKLS